MTNTNIARLFKMTSQGIGKWKKEKRPIVIFVEKYFTDENIDEFLETGKIQKFEYFNTIQRSIIEKNQKIYLRSFTEKFRYEGLASAYDIFIQFYFSFLVELKELFENKNQASFQLYDVLTSSVNNFLIKRYSKSLMSLSSDKKLQKETIENLNYENNRDLRNIQKNTMCFNIWGEDMFFYLEYLLKDNLQIFLDSDNEELIFHAVGFNVYYNLKDEYNDEIKDIIISNILEDKSKTNKKITMDDIYHHIKQQNNIS
ncbi:hypothetical protein CRV03_06915 [Arcobacter sp. F155]|uniref:hypothetical protein n=1 Tax=Arcobacter sp. F155 TaxID=2044512 RepID=UPI00100A2FB8|nr:hypothetical protein [Arcobacter sp. F155]RXJ76988.1 hypothetical protein CRV03_06915 [Arcobacter sp. F155]